MCVCVSCVRVCVGVGGVCVCVHVCMCPCVCVCVCVQLCDDASSSSLDFFSNLERRSGRITQFRYISVTFTFCECILFLSSLFFFELSRVLYCVAFFRCLSHTCTCMLVQIPPEQLFFLEKELSRVVLCCVVLCCFVVSLFSMCRYIYNTYYAFVII